jgi:hypothetical protein
MVKAISTVHHGGAGVLELPLISVARAVERLASDASSHERWARLAFFAFAFMASVCSVWFSFTPMLQVSVLLMAILAEFIITFVLKPRRDELVSLSRLILQREMYVASNLLSENSLSVISLKNKADATSPKVAEYAREWIQTRIQQGKKSDGSDFHSTTESPSEIRLLEILFENYSWWSELARRSAKRMGWISTIVLGLVFLSLVVLGMASNGVRLQLIHVLLQTLILVAGLEVFARWLRWRDAAVEFESRRTELSQVITLEHTELGVLHSYVADYTVITRSVAPVSTRLLDEQADGLNARVNSELRKRSQLRAAKP